MKNQQKKHKFINLTVIEDGQSVTKLDVPANFLKKVSWSEEMSKTELLRALWGNVYVIKHKDTEELLKQKGLI